MLYHNALMAAMRRQAGRQPRAVTLHDLPQHTSHLYRRVYAAQRIVPCVRELRDGAGGALLGVLKYGRGPRHPARGSPARDLRRSADLVADEARSSRHGGGPERGNRCAGWREPRKR